MHLSCRKKRVVDQAIHTSANLSKRNRAKINLFREKIVKAIWQDYISYKLLNN